MKRSNIKRLVLVVIVITVIFSFIPAAAAHGRKGKMKIRPIEDWLAAVEPGRHSLGGIVIIRARSIKLIMRYFLDTPVIRSFRRYPKTSLQNRPLPGSMKTGGKNLIASKSLTSQQISVGRQIMSWYWTKMIHLPIYRDGLLWITKAVPCIKMPC